MFGLLRIVRGAVGFLFGLQVIQVVEAMAWMLKPGATDVNMGGSLALLLMKAAFLLIAGVVFFWLRYLINQLHMEKRGVPHPALEKKRWAL